MGHNDIMSLYPIVQYVRKLNHDQCWGYTFSWDQGTYETMIIINEEEKTVRRPNQNEHWNQITYPNRPYCPDILEYQNKIIIEYEETEGKPRSGARLAKKGHNADGLDPRTSQRDAMYKLANFNVFKIFDYEKPVDNKKRLIKFLADVWYKNRKKAQIVL